MSSARSAPLVWHIGGEDVHLRIPLLLRLRELGFRVGAAGSHAGGPFAEHDIPYYPFPLHRWISPWHDRRTRASLRTLFLEHHPDIVHGFDTKPAILATFAARDARVPGRIRTINGMGYVFSSSALAPRLLRPVYRYLQTRASRAAHRTVFQNPDDRAYFRAHGMVSAGTDELVLGSGVDVDALLQSRPDEYQLARLRQELGLTGAPVVTMVARLVKQKGVGEYLRAARAVHEAGHDAAFLLVGPHVTEGRQRVRREELDAYASHVRHLGPRGDVSAILSASDLFVLPSYYREGIPRVLLEAGALGLPLITSDMPGCKEVVQPEGNGLLVPPRDAGSLARAIIRLLESPATRQAMGARSACLVREQFDLSIVADAHARIYEETLQRKVRTPQPA